MRGNLCNDSASLKSTGSIPAHAGKPLGQESSNHQPRVYPRACGETCVLILINAYAKGLSPRMRGNQGHRLRGDRRIGSIPAHAGKPAQDVRSVFGSRVYPRACGETLPGMIQVNIIKGLSPRMRGNRMYFHTYPERRRSIPAHAGKPFLETYIFGCARVYPRACGETLGGIQPSIEMKGLSPRMRGNLTYGAGGGPGAGSIPAHAGKPDVLQF